MSKVQRTERDRDRNTVTVALDMGTPNESDRLPGATKEYSGWDVYNNEARKVDTELVIDWRESLNSLLLFAAIFAAVLTAFIIESKKMLEQDPTSVMVDVMIFYTNNLANGSHVPYASSPFELDPYAITVNCLFYASLSVSLVAALASVVALQWVAEYDAAITRGGSSPEDRAKRRQFRYSGVLWWKMGEIIAALPFLLYCSVILFFIGLILWMWSIHWLVGSVVAGGASLAVLFYGVSTFLSVVFVSAPFRTPLSRGIYSSIRLSFSLVYIILRALRISSIPTWLAMNGDHHTTSQRREEQEVRLSEGLAIDALVWLVNHLNVSQDSYDRLLLIASELPKLVSEHVSPKFWDAPWSLIFDLLGWKNLRLDPGDNISKQDMHAMAVLANCYKQPIICDIISPKEPISYCWNENRGEYWSQYCDTPGVQWSPNSSFVTPNSLFLLLRDIPLSATNTSNDLELTIWLSRWRNARPMTKTNTDDQTDTRPEAMANPLPTKEQRNAWFSRETSSLYNSFIDRMMPIVVSDKIRTPPTFLDLIRWRFERVLLGDEDLIVEDGQVCLCTPLHYKTAIWKREAGKFRSVHAMFTLLLARNLRLFPKIEQIRRTKEVKIMLWVSTWDGETENNGPGRPQGIEEFFESNKTKIGSWIQEADYISYIMEVLEHLGSAQAEIPEIGSLWQTEGTDGKTELRIVDALHAFDSIIIGDITPQQHHTLVGLMCHEMEMIAPEAMKNHLNNHNLREPGPDKGSMSPSTRETHGWLG